MTEAEIVQEQYRLRAVIAIYEATLVSETLASFRVEIQRTLDECRAQLECLDEAEIPL